MILGPALTSGPRIHFVLLLAQTGNAVGDHHDARYAQQQREGRPAKEGDPDKDAADEHDAETKPGDVQAHECKTVHGGIGLGPVDRMGLPVPHRSVLGWDLGMLLLAVELEPIIIDLPPIRIAQFGVRRVDELEQGSRSR